MTMLALRTALVADTPLLTMLHKGCFARGWSEAEFNSFFARDGILAALAYLGEEPSGFSFAWNVAGECEYLALGVLEAYRGQGVGRRLLDYTLQMAEAAGVERVFLEVRVDNKAAINLYESAGFAVTGRRKNYYRENNEPPCDALTMCLNKRV